MRRLVRSTKWMVLALVVSLTALIVSPAAQQISLTRLQLIIGGSSDNEKVFFEATLRPDASATLDPAREDFVFALSVPTPLGDMATFYKVAIPLGGLSSADGERYSLTAEGATSSGLDSLVLTRAIDGSWSVLLKDNHAALMDLDYVTVFALIRVGDDPGGSSGSLSRTGNVWQLNG